MSPNDLLTFTRKKPFEPFRLLVSDGSTYDIAHPELCMVLQTSVIIGIPGPAGAAPAERVEWIDARHIVKAIPLTQPTTGDGGGPQTNGPQG